MTRIPTILFLFLCIGTASAQRPTAGLVGWYPFNGNALDGSGQSNDGTVNGATLTTDRFGTASSAYSFNGSSNDIVASMKNFPTGNSARTISTWFYTNSLPSTNYSAVITGYGSTTLACNSIYGSLLWSMTSSAKNVGSWKSCLGSSPDLKATYNYSLSNWYHLVVVYDGAGNEKIYINDSLLSSSSVGALSTQNGNFYIGSAFSLNSWFSGKLDDIAIYSRALSACEVHRLYDTLPFTTQPASISVAAASNAKFVAHTASILAAYQWQVNNGTGYTNLSNAGPYTGVNTDTLKISSVSTGMNNYLYRCILSYTGRSCADTSVAATLSVIPTGIGAAHQETAQIYPNPFDNEIIISWNNGAAQYVDLQIADVTGRIVRSGTMVGSGDVHIPTDDLLPGFYVLNIFKEGHLVITQKVIKQ